VGKRKIGRGTKIFNERREKEAYKSQIDGKEKKKQTTNT
jgi:hypothetical protein